MTTNMIRSGQALYHNCVTSSRLDPESSDYDEDIKAGDMCWINPDYGSRSHYGTAIIVFENDDPDQGRLIADNFGEGWTNGNVLRTYPRTMAACVKAGIRYDSMYREASQMYVHWVEPSEFIWFHKALGIEDIRNKQCASGFSRDDGIDKWRNDFDFSNPPKYDEPWNGYWI